MKRRGPYLLFLPRHHRLLRGNTLLRYIRISKPTNSMLVARRLLFQRTRFDGSRRIIIPFFSSLRDGIGSCTRLGRGGSEEPKRGIRRQCGRRSRRQVVTVEAEGKNGDPTEYRSRLVSPVDPGPVSSCQLVSGSRFLQASSSRQVDRRIGTGTCYSHSYIQLLENRLDSIHEPSCGGL